MFLVLNNRLIGYFKINSWAIMFAQFVGQIDKLFRADQSLQFTQLHCFISPKIVMKALLNYALLIFTECSPNGRTTYVVDGKGYAVQTDPASVQIVEL